MISGRYGRTCQTTQKKKRRSSTSQTPRITRNMTNTVPQGVNAEHDRRRQTAKALRTCWWPEQMRCCGPGRRGGRGVTYVLHADAAHHEAHLAENLAELVRSLGAPDAALHLQCWHWPTPLVRTCCRVAALLDALSGVGRDRHRVRGHLLFARSMPAMRWRVCNRMMPSRCAGVSAPPHSTRWARRRGGDETLAATADLGLSTRGS